MKSINPFFWFDTQAEEAAVFYTGIFGNSRINSRAHYGEAGPGPSGSVMTAAFQLEGRDFVALNGGPVYSFTPAQSLFVSCKTPEEIDELWRKLAAGGQVLMELQKYPFSDKFGWVNDRFGLSWQLNLGGGRKSIDPFLMFVGKVQGKAEEAINHYVSLFRNSRIERLERFAKGEMGQDGTVKHARFTLAGTEFMAMDSNAAHEFTFSPAFSLVVNCDSQEEIDLLWDKLGEGGKTSQCGWLDDRYGVTWQIVPANMGELMTDKDPARAKKIMEAMLKMTKLDIAALKRARELG